MLRIQRMTDLGGTAAALTLMTPKWMTQFPKKESAESATSAKSVVHAFI
jgi:hypothetical protein